MIASNYPECTGHAIGLHGKTRLPAERQAVQRRAVQSSHERCQVFGLNPLQRADLSLLSQTKLTDVQQRNARLCAQALPVMELLYGQLIHAHSMVLLTDASGVVLHAMGDPAFLERAQRVALAPGAVWSEAVKGTNAVGTALMTEAPTLVNGQDHFLREFQFLTCSAAPIFDHKGELLGVINVSGDRRSYHPHTLALATMAAHMVEAQWFNDMFRKAMRLHLHPNADHLGTLHEGIVALDESGRVLGVNRSAIAMLGRTATSLRHSDLPALFGLDLASMLELKQGLADQPLQLVLAKANHAAPSGGLRGAPKPDSEHVASGQLKDSTGLGGATAPAAPTVQCLHGMLSLAQRAGPKTLSPASDRSAHDSAHTSARAEPHRYASTQRITSASATLERALALTVSSEALRRASLQTSELGAEPKCEGSTLSAASTLRQTELLAIQGAILSCRGNLALAARQLGIGRSTLYRKLKELPAQAGS